MCKLEAVCSAHTGDITSIEFAEPYPLLISASTDGSICVWGVRPCAIKYRYKAIVRILNSDILKE